MRVTENVNLFERDKSAESVFDLIFIEIAQNVFCGIKFAL